jgi:hypothetical protein
LTVETSPRDQVSRVGDLLDTIGHALAEGRAESLLHAEQELGPAVQALAAIAARPPSIHPHDRPDLRSALLRCRAALARCQRLGASLEQCATAALEAGGRGGAYTRRGVAASDVLTASLKVRG